MGQPLKTPDSGRGQITGLCVSFGPEADNHLRDDSLCPTSPAFVIHKASEFLYPAGSCLVRVRIT